MKDLLNKYAPDGINNFLLNDNELNKLKLIYDLTPGMYILQSEPGTGKSTFIDVLKQNKGDLIGHRNILEFNGSLNNTVDYIKDNVDLFIKKKLKRIVIIEEADKLTKNMANGKGAQEALKDLISNHKSHVIFIFITNHIHDLIKPIRDRAVIIDFTPNKNKYIKLLLDVNRNENLKYTNDEIDNIKLKCYPSIRSALIKLQTGEILKDNQITNDIIKLIKQEIRPAGFYRKYSHISPTELIYIINNILLNNNLSFLSDEDILKIIVITQFTSQIHENIAISLFAYYIYLLNDESVNNDIINKIIELALSTKILSTSYFNKLNSFKNNKK